MNKQVVILAAGKGTRMNIDMPKVLAPILGRPMIEHVLDATAKVLADQKPVVVVGFQGEKVQHQIGDRAQVVWQPEQLGTGHAVAAARQALADHRGAIMVLYGDHPLVNYKTIENLFRLHEQSGTVLSMMTTAVEDFNEWRQGFFGFGRILRNGGGGICGIKELKDCTDEEKQIRELNPGYYCFDSDWLWNNIDELKNDNAQKEYYLTDLVKRAFEQNKNISETKIHPIECLGINTREQLELVEQLMKRQGE